MARVGRPDLQQGGLLRVVAVRPNSIADLDEAFRRFETPPQKIAAFFHEIVMMNYGARRLSEEFLPRAYRLCAAHDVPTVADEIQSCMWYEGLFLFPHYGLRPSMSALGKGFPGGEYPASRLLLAAPFDVMPSSAPGDQRPGGVGLAGLPGHHAVGCGQRRGHHRGRTPPGGRVPAAGHRVPMRIAGVEGRGHLLGLRFHDLPRGRAFVETMSRMGFDISVQAYKKIVRPSP